MIIIELAYLHNLQNTHNQAFDTDFLFVLALVSMVMDNLHHLIACIEKLFCIN